MQIPMLDQQKLRQIISTFRAEIEPCWSKETAYKIPEIERYGAYISGGQCAVTCLVLMDVLRASFLEEKIFLVSGQLQSRKGDVFIRDHSCLRMGSGEDAVIIDPTADQADAIDEKVIIGSATELEKQGLRYIEKGVEADQGEKEHPKRYQRYILLKEAWGSHHSVTRT